VFTKHLKEIRTLCRYKQGSKARRFVLLEDGARKSSETKHSPLVRDEGASLAQAEMGLATL
jgi:hypothetical protein